jgi:hypothetical protein
MYLTFIPCDTAIALNAGSLLFEITELFELIHTSWRPFSLARAASSSGLRFDLSARDHTLPV